MQNRQRVTPWWAALTVWGVVNAVNLLQAAGFLSRVITGSRAVNHYLGMVIIALVAPAALALVAFSRARANWRQWLGLVIFVAFVVLAVVVDYAWPVEFRSPRRTTILVPYLLLFFSSILLMGLPMFRMNRRLWAVTAITTVLLLGAMGLAMAEGVG